MFHRVNRGEHGATDLVVPAQDPVRYGRHLAAGLTSDRRQQHRNPVKNGSAGRDEVNTRREPWDQEQSQEDKQVDGGSQGTSCTQGSRAAADRPPMPSQDRSRKYNSSQNHRDYVEPVLVLAVDRGHTTWDADCKQKHESQDGAQRGANGPDLAPVAAAAISFFHSLHSRPQPCRSLPRSLRCSSSFSRRIPVAAASSSPVVATPLQQESKAAVPMSASTSLGGSRMLAVSHTQSGPMRVQVARRSAIGSRTNSAFEAMRSSPRRARL